MDLLVGELRDPEGGAETSEGGSLGGLEREREREERVGGGKVERSARLFFLLLFPPSRKSTHETRSLLPSSLGCINRRVNLRSELPRSSTHQTETSQPEVKVVELSPANDSAGRRDLPDGLDVVEQGSSSCEDDPENDPHL